MRIVFLTCLGLSWLAAAGEPKKTSAPKLDLQMPTFKEIPKDQKLESKKDPADGQLAPSGARPDEAYTVIRVVHGKSFTRSPDGAKPSPPFNELAASGNPLTTEKFSTVVRVKSPGKKNTRIEVVILDPRGDTVMDASGEIRFGTGVEAEWQVDWDSTSIRAPGDFQVLVRIGGAPLGTFPLKVTRTAN